MSGLSKSRSSVRTPQEALRYEFGKGIATGIKMTLDMIEGRGENVRHAPEGVYDGPISDELRDWISAARDNCATAEESGG